MLLLLSPAKSLDYETALPQITATTPLFVARSAELIATLQKFLNDPTVYYRIDQILMGVVQQIPTIARILNNAEVFMDKLARHPEALGLGGVVRPGSGIKDSPSSTGGLRIPPK